MLIHSSVGNTSFNFTENFALFETEIRIAKMSPINLPNSSMNPRLNPTTPSNTINNKARPSKNQDIYPNNSLKITLAVFPSMVFIWIMAILPLQKWSNIIKANSILAQKSNLIRINMVEFFNWEDPIALSESYLKQLSQP